MVLERFDQSGYRCFRCWTAIRQGNSGGTTNPALRVFEQYGQSRYRLLRIGTDFAEALGSGLPDGPLLVTQ